MSSSLPGSVVDDQTNLSAPPARSSQRCYTPNVTRKQFRQLHVYLSPCLGRLTRLRERMNRVDDPEYAEAVEKAWTAMYELNVKTHYRSCDGGVAGGDQPKAG